MASRILLCSMRLMLTRHLGVLAFEFGEDLGKDVQAGAFVGGDHDFAARHAMHFRQRDQYDAALLQRVFRVLLENFAGSGDGDFAAAAIEQPELPLLLPARGSATRLPAGCGNAARQRARSC